MFVLNVSVEELVEYAVGFYTTCEWKGIPDNHYPVVLVNQEYNVICTPAQLELCEFMTHDQSTIYVLSKEIINKLSKDRFTSYLKKEHAHKCDMEISETLIDNALDKLDKALGILIEVKDKYGTCNIEKMRHVFSAEHIKVFTTHFRTFLALQPETREWTEFQINYCWDVVLERVVERAKVYQKKYTHVPESPNPLVNAFIKSLFGKQTSQD